MKDGPFTAVRNRSALNMCGIAGAVRILSRGIKKCPVKILLAKPEM